MKYIQSLERLDGRVIFTLSDGNIYKGIINLSGINNRYYIHFSEGNETIFHEMDLKGNKFVENIVGYKCKGVWPETKTLEDLNKVLDALLKVNRPEEVIEENSKSPSEWDWLLN